MKIILFIMAIVISLTNISLSNSLDSGLVAYYPFNGNTNDESGNGNNGVNNGAALTSDRFGISNKAYSFNHTYIEVPNSASLQSPTTSLTLAFWVNISSWDNSNSGFMSKSNSAAIGQYGSLAATTPYIQFDLGGTYVRITRFFALNTWYFICLKWDGVKAKLYLNGDVYDSTNFSGTLAADSNPLELGKHSPGTVRYLLGKMDDIRIYKRALTNAEIINLYNESSISLTVIPQGFYDPANSRLRMKDTVRAYIRNSSSPYQLLDSSKAVIDSLTYQGNFRTYVPIGSYYIMVRHRNSIETWTSNAEYIEGYLSYDFTTSQSQAYGNNLVPKGGKYCIYSGDENQDGSIDVTDVIDIFNAANNFTTGYVKTDITGDRFVDIDDLINVYNNSLDFISVINPTTYQPPCNLTSGRTFSWSGFTWGVITSNETKCNPGPNYFSSGTDNVRVDSAGDLHLKITKTLGKYYCTELYTVQAVSYGTYTFYLSSRIDSLDKNIVLGLFTWNDINCVTNANSELDIEFTRWGDAAEPNFIEYSVQPTNGGLETERSVYRPINLADKYSIHFLSWTPSLVSFSSYREQVNPPPPANLITSWSFNNTNPAKRKLECNSNPVVIPDPQSNTTLNLNLWLNRGNYPSNNQEAEVIIHRIIYSPTFIEP